MGVWLIKYQPDPPRYEVLRDGEYATGVNLSDGDALSYWRAAQSLRANIVRRFEDAEPQFAANANEPEAVAFAEMLNA